MKRFLLAALLINGAWSAAGAAVCADHAIFERILKSNVYPDGYVDYDGIRVNRGGDLYEHIAYLEDADLKNCSENEKLAFWINAYNARVVRLVLARPALKDISEDFKLFGEKFKVARLNLSLNDIEHRVIRSSLKNGGPIEWVSLKELDPRIHFAPVCAAVGCPRLLNKAYLPAHLDDSLRMAAVEFANPPKHLRIEDGQLIISSLMRWYAEDFDQLGGPGAYLVSLTDPKLRADADEIDARIEMDFPGNVKFRYDWTLNNAQGRMALPVQSAPKKSGMGPNKGKGEGPVKSKKKNQQGGIK